MDEHASVVKRGLKFVELEFLDSSSMSKGTINARSPSRAFQIQGVKCLLLHTHMWIDMSDATETNEGTRISQIFAFEYLVLVYPTAGQTWARPG